MTDQTVNSAAGGNGPEPEQYDPSKDPKRKAKSGDPGWKYGYWHDMNRRDRIRCTFCGTDVHAGIARFKRHLAGASTKGKKNSIKCKKVPEAVSKKMLDFMKAYAKKHNMPGESDKEDTATGDEEEDATATQTSSRTTAKRKAKTVQTELHTQKASRTIAGMIRKTPEEVIELRHSKNPSQAALNAGCFKRTTEDKDRVDDHWAAFSYANAIPFNVTRSRAFEIALESTGQYGPGYIPPTIHALRLPLLVKAKKKTHALREQHELAWQEYGCTLMSDGWTDGRTRHLVNFLVNSPAGTFFIDSVDIPALVASKELLADLMEKRINDIGRGYVVQICTDNGANYKAAGRLLTERIPTLWWTPCAAHCLNLMLEAICKIKQFSECITNGKRVSTFIYRHGKVLDEMRVKTDNRDLVRAGATRFATNFLNLQSLHKHRQALKELFVGDVWHSNKKLSTSPVGQKVQEDVLSISFWNSVETCMKVSLPLLRVLRIVDGDEKPAMPEVMAAMDYAKERIKAAIDDKPTLVKKVTKIVEDKWESQMGVKLYGAALFLNPNRIYGLKAKPEKARYCQRLRHMFNEVLLHMEPDDDKASVISRLADDYERGEGECFSSKLAINDRTKKSPLLWWGAYGGLAYELQHLAKHIVSLCASASGCERNWSCFQNIHSKKRNRLEFQRLNDLSYVQYNRKNADRFQKIREEGSKGTRSDPLVLEDISPRRLTMGQ
ncbi:hypothetical protein VPH35_110398 [Triticum aestivum]